MSDVIAVVLPTAALTAALYGLWINATKDTTNTAIEVEYTRGGNYRKILNAGRRVSYPTTFIPVAVILILAPLACDILKGLSLAKEYSPVNALFLLIFLLWIAAGVNAVVDIFHLEINAKGVRKRERIDTRRPPADKVS
ncbi:hypothetical protein [Nonomuraea sp. 10N515B]|uniref:hypothetical protein n=1 Tax=Nonomuraea sp. 10N515B TaxID=3457422 RepID=UPI003FCC2804